MQLILDFVQQRIILSLENPELKKIKKLFFTLSYEMIKINAGEKAIISKERDLYELSWKTTLLNMH